VERIREWILLGLIGSSLVGVAWWWLADQSVAYSVKFGVLFGLVIPPSMDAAQYVKRRLRARRDIAKLS
jgi:hypothetical protein